MIDFTDRDTLVTVKAALRYALNSLDNDIASFQGFDPSTYRDNKLALLNDRRDRMTKIYNQIDENIG